jgi:polyisoprenyl-teichoic acid--peptidoglycan teichoic acid transferase
VIRSRIGGWAVAVVVAITATVLPRVVAGATYATFTRVQNAASFVDQPDAPMFLLLVGSDERGGLEGARGDALHVVGINPTLGTGTILNIPRDTLVDVPGRGPSKINDAYRYGGAELQAEVVRRLTGAPVSVVIATTFGGFQSMVDELGGVDVDVPFPMADSNSGAFFPQGRVHMSGSQALAFSRNRHLPDGDLNRTTMQARLLLSALADLRARGTGAADTLRYLSVLLRHVRVDGLSVRELYHLGRIALALDPATVRNYTMPAVGGWYGAASVIYPTAAAAGVFADFRDDAILQSH